MAQILLNRKALLAKEELKIEKVDLGKDEYAFVRQMTGRERDRFEQSLIREVKTAKGSEYKRSLEDFRAKLVVNTICDEKGDLLLHPEDVELLSTHMSAYRLEKLVNAAQGLNNITEEDKEALVKNSEAAPSGNSTSDSVES